jgi:hypothetical protein
LRCLVCSRAPCPQSNTTFVPWNATHEMKNHDEKNHYYSTD